MSCPNPPSPTCADSRRHPWPVRQSTPSRTASPACAGASSRASGRALEQLPDGAVRAQILTDNFDAPNPDDSFRSLAEQVLEDINVGGYGAIEVQATDDPERPLALWPVDGSTIRMRADWDGAPDSPRYVQATGKFGPDANVTLNDDELIYMRLNPRTHTPFGLGRLEVAFETINCIFERTPIRFASCVEFGCGIRIVASGPHTGTS